jgi:hypothetical protein
LSWNWASCSTSWRLFMILLKIGWIKNSVHLIL